MSLQKVMQMYIRAKSYSINRPVKEFKKISLKPGESKTVALTISPEHLSFINLNMEYIVEPGESEIMVGNSSRDEDLQKIVLLVES